MYSFTSRVRYSEIDETGKLSIPSLVNYLQDCTTFGSEELGLGPAHTAETGLAWLLSAWKIDIAELPSFGDEIRVSTWATGFKGLRASRNFTVCRASDDAAAHPLVRADSSWFMFDANKGRPIRIPESESAPYVEDARNDSPLDLPPIQRVIRIEGEGQACTPITVTGAHIDTNHHVNNAQYVSLALGVLEEGEVSTPCALDVHYSRAAKLGDTIYPHLHRESPANGSPSTIVTLDDEAGSPYAIVRLS